MGDDSEGAGPPAAPAIQSATEDLLLVAVLRPHISLMGQLSGTQKVMVLWKMVKRAQSTTMQITRRLVTAGKTAMAALVRASILF